MSAEGPSPLLPMPACAHRPRRYSGPSAKEVLEARRHYCNPALLTYYEKPLMIVEGHMQYLFDERGRRYLDFFAGIVTVSCGHCHPRIVEKIAAQTETLQHTTTIYLHPNMPLFAERLAAKMPDGLDVTYFVNSGSEAIDLAILMARLYTGSADVIALRGGYHGGGSATPRALTAHSTWKYPIAEGGPMHHTFSPDPYRSPFSGSPEEIARKSVEEMADLIRHATPGRVAAFIAEPITGVGGVTSGSPEYLPLAYDLARRHGGLCIADEVQTGFGRTGESYWGFENSGVVPDMVVTAKGIGNGVALAAVTTKREIAEALTERLHFNTFGGNPVAMAAGLAVLDVIDREGLQENCRVVGGFLKRGLAELQERHPLVGDVRGMGLMLGVELVRDRETKEPAGPETAAVLEECRKSGLLLGKSGFFGNVLRIKPPMCITKEDAEFALSVLDRAFGAVEGGVAPKKREK